jgi:hypothetical protein
MDAIVRDYHPDVGRTGRNVADLIQGTAVFPGGCGLWRGDRPRGPMPEYFPKSPVMLVAHNFDSVVNYQESRRAGTELPCLYWDVILRILKVAGLDPVEVFFTNALMGLKPGNKNTGDMPTVEGYEEQCREFLRRQIEIVEPRITVALGQDAHWRLLNVVPNAEGMVHPSWFQYLRTELREARIREEGERLGRIVRRARDRAI